MRCKGKFRRRWHAVWFLLVLLLASDDAQVEGAVSGSVANGARRSDFSANAVQRLR